MQDPTKYGLGLTEGAYGSFKGVDIEISSDVCRPF